MKITRILTLLAVLAAVAPASRAEEKVNDEVVKAVRAALSAKHLEEQDKLVAAALARSDKDWPSFKKGMEEGPYYQKPLVTAFGERHSGKHLNLTWSGENGKPLGFSFYVPKQYDAKKGLPVLLYLHHQSSAESHHMGGERAGVARLKFKAMCEEFGIFFIAPYTCKGAEWWTPQGKRLILLARPELEPATELMRRPPASSTSATRRGPSPTSDSAPS